jgi:monovalent cation/hydrogen antiporter
MGEVEAVLLALALSLTVANGAPFPDRSLVIFLAFCVITVTLLAQGLTLTQLIRRLGLHGDESSAREEAMARAGAERAALHRLHEIANTSTSLDGHDGRDGKRSGTADGGSVTSELARHLQNTFERRLRRHLARGRDENDQAAEAEAEQDRHLRAELVRAQQEAVIALRDEGEIGDDVMRTELQDLDLEDQRLQ